jgi:hypothetical protein
MPKKLPPMKSIGTVIVFLVVGLISLGAYYFWQRRAMREGLTGSTENKKELAHYYIRRLTDFVNDLLILQQAHTDVEDETAFAISYGTLHKFRLEEAIKKFEKDLPGMYDWPTLTNTPEDIKKIKDILSSGPGDMRISTAPTNKEECDTPGEEMFNTCFYKGEMGDFIVGRQDKSIDFDWNQESPDPAVPNDDFSASWVGAFLFDDANYKFTATGDDGIRLSINGTPVQFDEGDGWKVQGPTTYTYTTKMKAGPNTIKFEYYEKGGGAVAKLNWEKKIKTV